MGSPPVDGGRHRLHEPDIGAPRTIMFATSLPDRDIDQLTVRIPTPRAPLDPPTEAIRHVVVPPQPSYDPYDGTYWDGDVVQDTGYAQRPPPARGGRWGVVLGALVVTGCAAYIAVVGIGGIRSGAAAPASTALTAPEVSATFPASAVPPAVAAEAAVPTSLVAILRRTPAARPVAPVTTTAVPPTAVAAVPTTGPSPGPVAQERSVQGTELDDGSPQLADPPREPAAQGSGTSPRPRTGSVPTPPSGTPKSGATPGG